ncbi:AraC family ligand binding domain-containing protein [Acerihabitans sp. TG2]|uniref:AraC family ligand binding domain-containing protein n=1 Tax=Acerihabitans sp. TG2 TaxID=3096008 RepID=UPI002B23E573|nr:AraC family ligand binding domain-containing protein [Acerihabitans sp. TG2]MEA9391882.1 AraC family ligand binding domain-containing protein [Acerihabitans sp. TG2]
MIVFRNTHIELAALTNGRSFPRHTHDEFVISANLNGLEQVWLDGDVLVADTQMITTYNPGQVQASMNQADSWQCVSLYLRSDGFEHYFHRRVQFNQGGLMSPELSARLKNLILQPQEDARLREEAAVMLLADLQNLTGTACSPRDARGESHRARRVKALMLDDISQTIGLEALARREGVSAAHLVHAFAV